METSDPVLSDDLITFTGKPVTASLAAQAVTQRQRAGCDPLPETRGVFQPFPTAQERRILGGTFPLFPLQGTQDPSVAARLPGRAAGADVWGQKGKSHIQRAPSQGRGRRRCFSFFSPRRLRMHLNGLDEDLLLSIHSQLHVTLFRWFTRGIFVITE